MDVALILQNPQNYQSIPAKKTIEAWVLAVLVQQGIGQPTELAIRVVDASEMTQLNAQYRQKNKLTNVLSFPFEAPVGVPLERNYLGDIVICEAVVLDEANAQQKTAQAHWAHLVVHGVLHLLGYDHEKDTEAEIMETLEINILAGLGVQNPYFVKGQL